ncbi:MAG: dihydroorotate dehydrogenase [Candidatus Heimdallarchaeota archaeon]
MLQIKLCGVRLDTPLMLAAGILGLSGSLMRRVAQAGAGAIVTKSIGYEPREGYANPTVVEVTAGFINAIGLSNPGFRAFKQEISEGQKAGKPVFVSVFGATPQEVREIVEGLEETDPAGYELNVSCPHGGKYGAIVGQDPDLVKAMTYELRKVTKRPLFVKLSSNVTDIVEIGLAAQHGGADAVTAINTLKAMVIDPELWRPILANKIGGLSGPAIKPVAVRCVYELAKKLDIPVIGVGGIFTWQDVVEFLLAGAHAVQIGSAIAQKGLTVFNQISKGLRSYLTRRNLEHITQLIGKAHDPPI